MTQIKHITPSLATKKEGKVGFVVRRAGILSLIQDAGRFGQQALGLTEGGPADNSAFEWCHTLLGNNQNASAIEISIGGLLLESHCHTTAVVTGAQIDIKLNGKSIPQWQTFTIKPGDQIEFGYAVSGVRSYFSVIGGFAITPQFGSCATVVREGIGGLNGTALKVEDQLPVVSHSISRATKLETEFQPQYVEHVKLRIVLGYQSSWFETSQLSLFLNSTYEVSKQWDRMGYRLSGPAIKTDQTTMYSEGIALGSVQIPADGQPIVLMHDRQTIGGYPKVGTVLSLDLDKLSQCKQGAKISFEAITMEDAHNVLHLAQYKKRQTPITHLVEPK